MKKINKITYFTFYIITIIIINSCENALKVDIPSYIEITSYDYIGNNNNSSTGGVGRGDLLTCAICEKLKNQIDDAAEEDLASASDETTAHSDFFESDRWAAERLNYCVIDGEKIEWVALNAKEMKRL